MPRLKLPIRPKRRRQPLPDRLARVVVSRWWHPAAYLVLAALIAGDVWWAAFPVALLSGALWGLHAYLAPLMEQDRQRQATVNTALGDAARAMREAADLMHNVAVVAAGRAAPVAKVNPSSNGSRQADPGA